MLGLRTYGGARAMNNERPDSRPLRPLGCCVRFWLGFAFTQGVLFFYLWLGWPCITKKMKGPQRHGADFDPPIFFVFVLCKMLQVVPKCPRTIFTQNKKFFTQNVFWGFVTPPPHTKT
jgi:hypothetical protein